MDDDTYKIITATIASGESLSAAIDLEDYKFIAFIFPSGWTTAALTFKGSHDNGVFFDIYDNAGAEISLTVSGMKCIVLTPTVQQELEPIRFIKLRSGTTASPVAQGAAREIKVLMKK
jgi:hypothetical protein